MNEMQFWAAIVAVLIGCAALYNDTRRPEEQRNALTQNNLPLFFLVFVALPLIRDGTQGALIALVSGWFTVFLHIAVYYALLLALLPLLRKRISPKACACLWTIPSCLYFFFQFNFPGGVTPKIILCWPGYGIRVLAVIWLAGFAGILLWHTAAHLIYRRRLLREACEETDPEILTLWREMQKEQGIEKADLCLVRSPETETPLSIGLFRKTLRVVLPVKHYTISDLRLIFRHELIHIRREDCWTKLSLLFYASTCWFLPLMWIAMRRSADDLELSCDEAVLCAEDDAARHRYAELILNSAGDQRGYTTCLSASASALRYRLKHIMLPQKRSCGALTLALVTFALMASVGSVVLAYGGAPAEEAVFNGDSSFADYRIVYASGLPAEAAYDWHQEACPGQRELTDYLDSLKLYEITRFRIDRDADPELVMELVGQGRRITACLYGHTLAVNWYERTGELPPYSSYRVEKQYYIEQEPDWDELTALVRE